MLAREGLLPLARSTALRNPGVSVNFMFAETIPFLCIPGNIRLGSRILHGIKTKYIVQEEVKIVNLKAGFAL